MDKKLALASYQRAIELDPQYFKALHNLGRLYREDFNDYQAALDCYNRSKPKKTFLFFVVLCICM